MLWSDKAVPHNFYSFVSTPPTHTHTHTHTHTTVQGRPAVRRCFRWGAETKVGPKPVDKAAQGVDLGGIFRLLPCRIFLFYVLIDNSS